MIRVKSAVGLFAVFSACVVPVDDDAHEAHDEHDDQALGHKTQSIIYGQDDRREVFDHPNETLRALAQSSVVALIPKDRVVRSSNGEYGIQTLLLKDALRVCEDERFAREPTSADCSGVLIDDDLVLTAGHCFSQQRTCENFAFVFDYYYRADGQLEPISFGDIYGCRRVVDRKLNVLSPRLDYAVVQLDRPALGRTPAPLRSAPVVEAEPLATIGSASGLPFKIDSGSRVLNTRAPRTDFFLLDSDTFAGSSGSGVFDHAGQLVGVLVRGGEDYERKPDASCMVAKVVELSDGGVFQSGSGEEATYLGRVVEGVCALGWPSMHLCGKAPRCGDGFCTDGETRVSCAADCQCRDGQCDPALEVATIPADGGIQKSRLEESEGCATTREPARGSGLLGAALALLLSAVSRRRRTSR